MLERVRIFANEMLTDNSTAEEDSDGDDLEVVSPPSPSNSIAIPPAELMTRFRTLMSSSMDDLLDNILNASSCLEGKDRGSLKGAVSSIRKANSLVGRWLDKSGGAVSASTPIPKEDLIERDTIISANVTVGRGASSITVAKHYRVLDVHDKYYNKWFMSKVPSKKWKKDSKFKLKACMKEINAVQ